MLFRSSPVSIEVPLLPFPESRPNLAGQPLDVPILVAGPLTVIPERHPVMEWELLGQRGERVDCAALEVLPVILPDDSSACLAPSRAGRGKVFDRLWRGAFDQVPVPYLALEWPSRMTLVEVTGPNALPPVRLRLGKTFPWLYPDGLAGASFVRSSMYRWRSVTHSTASGPSCLARARSPSYCEASV